MSATYSPATIQAMREWAMDCAWQDAEEIPDMSDAEIVRGVARHFDGGVAGFLLTLPLDNSSAVADCPPVG